MKNCFVRFGFGVALGIALVIGISTSNNVIAAQTTTKQNRYLTITHRSYNIWNSLGWDKLSTSDQHLNQTYLTTSLVKLTKKSSYYGLIDSQGKWAGYINANAVTLASGPQGAAIKYGKYVSVVGHTQPVLKKFAGQAIDSSKYVHHTLLAKYVYHTASGDTYYSSSSSQGWQGYFPAANVKVASNNFGISYPSKRFVTVTASNYRTYRNTAWQLLQSSKKIYHRTLLVKSTYYGYNGYRYFSLYDNKNHFQGLINAKGTRAASGEKGIYIAQRRYVMVDRTRAIVWQNFNWPQIARTS